MKQELLYLRSSVARKKQTLVSKNIWSLPQNLASAFRLFSLAVTNLSDEAVVKGRDPRQPGEGEIF